MEDLRLKKVEISVHTLNRRVDDAESRMNGHDSMLNEHRKEIDMLQHIYQEHLKTNELVQEVVEYAKKTYEVVHPLAKVVGAGIKLGAAGLIVWHAVKLLIAKVTFF